MWRFSGASGRQHVCLREEGPRDVLLTPRKPHFLERCPGASASWCKLGANGAAVLAGVWGESLRFSQSLGAFGQHCHCLCPGGGGTTRRPGCRPELSASLVNGPLTQTHMPGCRGLTTATQACQSPAGRGGGPMFALGSPSLSLPETLHCWANP